MSIYLFVIGLLLFAAWAGALPTQLAAMNRPRNHLVYYGEAFASGTFLGASLLHMLPDAIDNLSKISVWEYPVATTLTGVGFLVMLMIERIGIIYKDHSEHAKHVECSILSYILLIILSFHSIIVGLSLGLEQGKMEAIVLMVALMLHKASAGFAFGMTLRYSSFKHLHRYLMIAIFSLSTPLGIAIGLYITHYAHMSISSLTEGMFDSVAAGTFLYMTMHLMQTRDPYPMPQRLASLGIVIVGFVMMAVLALYI